MKQDIRPYDDLAARLSSLRLPGATGPCEERMQAVADALWEALRDRGVSWVGFYLADPAAPEETRLVLGPHRDTPACSPIGLHGVCGQAWRSGGTRIVHDVHDLGDAYVACDPRDRSEIVIALVDAEGVVWGVLDLDSREVGAFGEPDEAGLLAVLVAAGLHEPSPVSRAR